MTRFIQLAAAPLLVLLSASTVCAQTASDVRDVVEGKTRIGDRLTIDTRDGARVKGRLVDLAADAIVIEHAGGQQSFGYDAIDRVRRRRNGVLLGAIIGLGTGITLGIPLRMLVNNETGEGNKALIQLAVFGTGVGIALDAAMSVNRTIYRRDSGSIALGVTPERGGAALRLTARW